MSQPAAQQAPYRLVPRHQALAYQPIPMQRPPVMDSAAAGTRSTSSSSQPGSKSGRHSKKQTSRTSDLLMTILTLGAWLFVRLPITIWHNLGINKSKTGSRLH
jgi:hypothetical protein